MHLLKLDRRWNVKHARHRLREPVPRAPAPPPVPLQHPRARAARRCRRLRGRRTERPEVSVRAGAATGLDPPALWIRIGVRHARTQEKTLGLHGKFVR